MNQEWNSFAPGDWQHEVNVSDFIRHNYTQYEGDASFLANAKESTRVLWDKLQALQKEERAKGGVLDMDTDIVSSITSHKPGYLDKDLEVIVGLQTDKPLKRAFMPFGGIKMAEEACETYGYKPSPELHKIFTDAAASSVTTAASHSTASITSSPPRRPTWPTAATARCCPTSSASAKSSPSRSARSAR